MVPVGVTPAVRVAVSVTVPPTVAVADAWVVTVGLALVTAMFSSPQVVVAGLLLVSPL